MSDTRVVRGKNLGQCFSTNPKVCGTYGNLTPYESTLWVRVKATCHSSWLYSLCTEDTWKATARVHRVMEDW